MAILKADVAYEIGEALRRRFKRELTIKQTREPLPFDENRTAILLDLYQVGPHGMKHSFRVRITDMPEEL